MPATSGQLGGSATSEAIAAAMPTSARSATGITIGSDRTVSAFSASGDQRNGGSLRHCLQRLSADGCSRDSLGAQIGRFLPEAAPRNLTPAAGLSPSMTPNADDRKPSIDLRVACSRRSTSTIAAWTARASGARRIRSRLALVRLRAAPGRAALVALGIAAGAAMLALAVGGSAAVRDRAVSRGARAHRPVRVVAAGRCGAACPRRHRCRYRARRRCSPRARDDRPGRPFGVSLFRQAKFGGAFVNLGGVDGLARWIRLRSGRLPGRCTPRRCELVLVGGTGACRDYRSCTSSVAER